MSGSVQTQIIDAIEQMRVVELLYKGSWRTIEPHLLGINKKGNLCLSAFQTAGGSGLSWRAYLVDEIDHIALQNTIFTARDGYNPNDSTMLSIIACI